MRESLSERVKQAARGNWPYILQNMGIPAKLLDGRNHACPACGGTDRFQYTVRGAGAEWGRFACRGLDAQGGDGFKLVMHVFDLSFADAVRVVARVLGIDYTHQGTSIAIALPEKPKQNPAETQTQIAANAAKLQSLFDVCEVMTPQVIAGRYLINRGIAARSWPEPHSSPLRHCAALDYWHVTDNQPHKLGAFPALLARVDKPNGALAGLHRIYLSDDGAKRVIRMATGSPERPHFKALDSKKLKAVHDGALRGAACRLYPVGTDGRLALTEGIETALAVHSMTGLAAWSCISAGCLKSVVLPADVREVLIYADNDSPDSQGRNAGKEAAYLLAARLIEEGRKVKVLLPPQAGTDWLDVLNDELNQGKA
ncbi:toprim domain-containing protein [Chitinibacter sp. FCG-7]|uniref:Toprim domain-containing protein n=1 Tax=Chitinibacter mangrovi TaxID=3153927 RepID=A0AAU7F7P2_9NEIS